MEPSSQRHLAQKGARVLGRVYNFLGRNSQKGRETSATHPDTPRARLTAGTTTWIRIGIEDLPAGHGALVVVGVARQSLGEEFGAVGSNQDHILDAHADFFFRNITAGLDVIIIPAYRGLKMI
jgi:hypothetical protein